jgi:phosphatidylglycerol:prolipoprotein diacylglycerol transferase
MHPVIFKSGPFTVYSYGLFVAVGFVTAVFLARRRAAKFGVSRDLVLDLFIILLVSGVAGARALYVALNFEYYRINPMEILNLSKGGLVWYGGFFAAIAAAAAYIRRKRAGFFSVTDLVTPYIALAQALGRVGCFLNGCCYGAHGIPVQIYSAALLIIIFVILRLWQDRRRFIGEITLAYCILYAIKRFGIEFLRCDTPKAYFGLTISQVISLAVIFTAIPVFIVKAKRWNGKGTASK